MVEEDEREEELGALTAIYPELIIDPQDAYSANIDLAVAPTKPLLTRFVPSTDSANGATYRDAATSTAHIEHDVHLAHLPPLTLRVTLPQGYPSEAPPNVRLSSNLNWLPKDRLVELEADAVNLWEEFGRCQILFSYIDHLQQAAERAFDLEQSAEGCLVLSAAQESDLSAFDEKTRQATFDAGTYDCGVCLEPKKGVACYQMRQCGHVFCRQCLQDFYNNAIKEGDVVGVKCLDPSCGEEKDADGRKRRKRERTLHPRELLAMGVDESIARRYVEMKRKKKIEADKSTVYCPRTWCQGPAKSDKYPPLPADLSAYIDNEIFDDDKDVGEKLPPTNKDNKIPPDPSDRLVVCEKCTYAFCKVCYMGWHGPFARCFPRDPNELSAEEKASYDYIRMNTSPCPYCNAPVQKTMGCNHMNCFQCRTHFCYLCGSWLDAHNPYQHFNKPGTPCYQRLWELEEGDEGQAPDDGRGFVGGARGWEQMALDAAHEAEAAEIDAAAAEAQAVEDEPAAELQAPWNDVPLIVAVAQLDFNDIPDDEREPHRAAVPRRGGRRARNPLPRAPAAGAAQVVRNHERAGGRGGWRPPPAARAGDGRADLEDREQAELQRFLEMARRDEEDDWDSDELGDDEPFIIPDR
ncbi:E3 ubiquitin- ligase itt1 [Lecanosticta acicola]|uniref:RBR-type E3 ubiquitin transferase n=1 Tax=Lecanosticta acicola TaxID=111012 RepID=A0AAI9EBD6_9PEZI|nr:E3 ubiquitin- ligase itt1 [Lecanosticta acicola]